MSEPGAGNEREQLLDQILADYLEALERGQAPGLPELLERYPVVGRELQDFFDGQERLEQLAAPLRQAITGAAEATSNVSETLTVPTSPVPLAPSRSAELDIPGYEILGVLGRGGMGIVYKARQVSLKRQVALKMIVSGEHAGSDALMRFRTEAEAVARLQHPHIVQIHEIGEQKGLPYFSLEFVTGGSLAQKLGGKPMLISEAVRVMTTLARAIQYCHQQGIVHRDLKPANVLMTVEGEPKITDFGLAKHLESDSGQTRSGAIMGTPSYMAPEQAAGRIRDVGPLTDVYALGALFYEMLTGCPPFRGETLVETLEQVRSCEPKAPSRLQPKVPRDLETICLKALAKDPARRYSSALALAQDLERFEAGESILARRESLASRVWRRVRRNRLASAALFVIALGVIATYLAVQTFQKARQLTTVTQEIETGLQSPELTEAYLGRMHAQIAQLDRHAPGEAVTARQRLHQSFAEHIRSKFRDRVVPEEKPTIEAALELLAARDSELANTVRKEYQQRQRTWQTVFDLVAPFSGLPAVFEPAAVRIERVQDVPCLVRISDPVPLVTHQACATNNKIEAVFHASWASASQLGLVFHADKGQSYTLLLRLPIDFYPTDAQGKPVTVATFEDVRKAKGPVLVQILRNNQVRLNEQEVMAADVFGGCQRDGSLRLEARQEGELLSWQVNRLKPIEFRESFSVGVGTRVFAVHWPRNVPLLTLRAARLPDSSNPSALEQGDIFYSRGETEKAIAHYQQVAATTRDRRVRREARCKEGLCLVAVNRAKEAIPLFEEASADAGDDPAASAQERWPVLADCQLLLIHVRLREPDSQAKADALLEKMSARYAGLGDQISAFVPHDDRAAMLIPHGHFHSYVLQSRSEDDLVRTFERVDRAADLFGASMAIRVTAKHYLFVAYGRAGRYPQAYHTGNDLFQQCELQPHLFNPAYARDFCRMLCFRGDRQLALTVMNKWLERYGGSLWLERAKINASLKNWGQAEKDLEQYMRWAEQTSWHDPRSHVAYTYYSLAFLLKGFLREQQGDAEGALAAWRQGLPRAWAQNDSEKMKRAWANPWGVFNFVQLASLTNELSDKDTDDIITYFISESHVNPAISKALKSVAIPTAVLRESIRSPRGRQAARQEALWDFTENIDMKLGGLIFMHEIIHQGASPGPLDKEVDDLIWKLANDFDSGLRAREVSQAQCVALALIWSGADFSGLAWSTFSANLKADVRGPSAYVLGLRSRQLNKPGDAAKFFRAALADAPADSALKRLAQTELDRLKNK